MRVRTLPLFLLLLAFAGSAFADVSVTMLLPLSVTAPVPGANGSLWATDLVVRNFGLSTVNFMQPEGCGVLICPPGVSPWAQVKPGETVHLNVDAPGGTLLVMNSADTINVAFNLRVRDLSRQSQTWGTELPVILFTDISTTTFHLLNVPLGGEFRTTVRVYDVSTVEPRQFRVRLYSLDDDSLLSERVITTAHVPGGGLTSGSTGDLVPPGRTGAGRIEVTPLNEGSRFWTFASVTNNATQHVTLITRHP